MKVLDTDLHWLAGFLEGEGTFTHRRVHGRWFQLQISATNADWDVLARCQTVAGGRIGGPYSKGDGKYRPNKVQWTWHLSTMKEAADLMRALRPLMGRRRQSRIDECLAAYEAKVEIPMAERTHCPQGHAYDEANTGLYRDRNGKVMRRCKRCSRERAGRWRAANPEKAREAERMSREKRRRAAQGNG